MTTVVQVRDLKPGDRLLGFNAVGRTETPDPAGVVTHIEAADMGWKVHTKDGPLRGRYGVIIFGGAIPLRVEREHD